MTLREFSGRCGGDVAGSEVWVRSASARLAEGGTTFLLQNWQPEFLAVGSMAILAVYLRQRGSPESKPVGAPHTSTGVEG